MDRHSIYGFSFGFLFARYFSLFFFSFQSHLYTNTFPRFHINCTAASPKSVIVMSFWNLQRSSFVRERHIITLTRLLSIFTITVRRLCIVFAVTYSEKTKKSSQPHRNISKQLYVITSLGMSQKEMSKTRLKSIYL